MTNLSPMEWAWRPMTRFAQFSGRAPRAEYWWFTLATTIIGYVFDLIDKVAGETGFIGGAFSLAILLPSLSVGVRRLHDTGRSGWWAVAFFLAFVPIGVLAFTAGDLFEASGFSLLAISTLALVAAVVILGLALLIFSILPGDAGANRYGPDPYGPDRLEEVFA